MANNTTVNGVYMIISSGGVHSGSLQINGGTVWAYSGAIIDFTVAEQADASVALINDWGSITGRASAIYTLTVNNNQAAGAYSLAGEASAFSNTVTVKTTDEDILGKLTIDETLADVVNCREYTLSHKGVQLRLNVAIKVGEVAAKTGTIPVNPDTGIAAATWGGTTIYTAGRIYAGNSDATNTVLFIDNAGATGANKTYAFGGAAGTDMEGEADIRLYRGTIGAIMGGAQDANHSVGAVDIQIGGGKISASTGVVYGGGFGSVDGNIKITTSKGAVVTGQVYGGPMITSGLSVDIGGNIDLSLNGGTLASDVTGGARVQADTVGTTSVAGSASILIDGATFTGGANASIYGGGWVYGKAASAKRSTGCDYSIGGVTVSVNTDVKSGTGNGRGIFGGALASEYAVVQVNGDVNVTVTGASVGNVYGGGWAQSGAESNIVGNVNVSLVNASVDVIYGGGAHGATAEVSGTTNVSGNVSILVDNSTVNRIFASGQTKGDAIDGTTAVTIRGASTINAVYGTGFGGYVGAASANLTLDGFTGTIRKELLGFDSVVIAKNTTATFASDAEISGSKWTFDLSSRTETAAALKWGDGAFDTADFNLILGETATEWTVCDLSGDDVKSDAFENVSFQLAIYGETYNYTLGETISDTWTAWDGATLDYSDETGLLKFTLA